MTTDTTVRTADTTDYSPDRYVGTCECGQSVKVSRSGIIGSHSPLGYEALLARCPKCQADVWVKHAGILSAIRGPRID